MRTEVLKHYFKFCLERSALVEWYNFADISINTPAKPRHWGWRKVGRKPKESIAIWSKLIGSC